MFTIGELAKAAGVPTSTVRYYEREGILRPAGRNGSNYRLYSREDVERLCFIRAAQGTGFTLRDVTELLRPAARCSASSSADSRPWPTVCGSCATSSACCGALWRSATDTSTAAAAG